MDFDSNAWYRLTTAASMKTQQSLAGTFPLVDGEEGFVISNRSDNTAPSQQWQLFPTSHFTFMLRTKASGSNGYLATEKHNETKLSATARIYNHSRTDSSMLWRVLPWGDGTFYLSNMANGRESHLDFSGSRGIAMSTNTTQPQPGQAFSFVKLGKINDSAFSTANTPRPTPTTTSRASSISTPEPTVHVFTASTSASQTSHSNPASTSVLSGLPTLPPQTPHDAGRLSPSAAMGIGVTIGAVGLVSLIGIALFVYRRWRSHYGPESKNYRQTKLWQGFTPATSARTTAIHEKPGDNVYIAELPVPASPPAALSPPLSGGHISWGTRMSWQTFPGSPIELITPIEPPTPLTPLAELPV